MRPFKQSQRKRMTKLFSLFSPIISRITIAEVLENGWFKKGHKKPIFECEEVALDDVDALFNETADSPNSVVEMQVEQQPTPPLIMTASELIPFSQSLNLNSLFEKQMGFVKRETRFASKCYANEIASKLELAAGPLDCDVKKKNYKMKLDGEKSGHKGHLSIATEIFEVAPSLHIVQLHKTGGDTLEFHTFYKNLSVGLKDIVWKTGDKVNIEANNASDERTEMSLIHRKTK